MEDSPDIFLIGWGNPTFDGAYAMNPWFMEGPFWHFESEEMEDLLTQAADEPDEDAREDLLMQANELAHDEAAWVFLNQQYSIYGASEDIAWEARNDEDILLKEIFAAE